MHDLSVNVHNTDIVNKGKKKPLQTVVFKWSSSKIRMYNRQATFQNKLSWIKKHFRLLLPNEKEASYFKVSEVRSAPTPQFFKPRLPRCLL